MLLSILSSCLIVSFYYLVPVFLSFSLQPSFLNSSETRERIFRIDFFRLIFTLFVILHHILNILNIYNRAQYSVEFFFVLSGFMLVYTFKNTSIFQFTIKKLFHFLPYALLANTLALFFVDHPSIIRFLSSVSLFASTGVFPISPYYVPTWYLSVLFWVSIFYFILLKYARSKIVNLTVSLIILICIPYMESQISMPIPKIPFITYGMVRGIFCMGMGYFLGLFYITYQPTLFSASKKISWIYSGLEVITIGLICSSMFIPSFFFSQFLIFPLFILILYLFLLKRGWLSNFFNKPVTTNLAKYTLPIFMTHDIFTTYILGDLLKEFKQLYEFKITLSIVTILVCILFGILIHHIFRYLKKLLFNNFC